MKMGKVRYLGASSMMAWEFSKALHLQKANGWARFVSCRTTTTCSPVRKSAKCCRSAPTRACGQSSIVRSHAAAWPDHSVNRPGVLKPKQVS